MYPSQGSSSISDNTPKEYTPGTILEVLRTMPAYDETGIWPNSEQLIRGDLVIVQELLKPSTIPDRWSDNVVLGATREYNRWYVVLTPTGNLRAVFADRDCEDKTSSILRFRVVAAPAKSSMSAVETSSNLNGE